MATLAIGLIVYEVAVQWQSVTGGYMGISGIPPLGIGGFEIVSDRGAARLPVADGRCWRSGAPCACARRASAARLAAIAGSEDAARALGIDVAHYKLMAFLISAAYAALAGSLFVHVVGFVSPEVYGLHMVVLAFTMLYVGGIGTAAGPLIGAVIISLLPETFRALKDYQDLAYGAGLILLLIYAPKGLAALGDLLPRSKASMTLACARARDAAVRRPRRGRRRSTCASSRAASPPSSARTAPARPRCSTSISGFQTPDAGRIVFEGKDITGSPPERIAAHGLVRTFQLVQLFRDLTVIENVKVGCHLHTRGGVAHARCCGRSGARQAEAAGRGHARASCSAFVGLDAYADLPAAALTYGRQRLLEIARALAAKPKLLLLDEPAAGLNSEEIAGCSRRPSAASSRKAPRCC